MIELQEQSDQHKNSKPARRQGLRFILLLLGVLAGSFIVFQYVILRAVAEWTTPQLEALVDKSMHRVVHFGKVWWTVSVYGVSLHTDKLSVTELDGKPFIDAGRTQISIALTPLLQRQVFLRHVDIDHLVVRARRVSDTTWNFSDLPKMPPLKDLSHVRINDGQVEVSDARDSSIKPLQLSSVSVKLDRKLFSRDWPFAVSAELAQPSGVSHLSASGVGTGDPDDWMTNEHKIKLKADALKLDQLTPYLGKINVPPGFVSFALDAKVLPEKSFEGKVDLQAPNLVLQGLQMKFKGPLPLDFDTAGSAKLRPGSSLAISQGRLQLPGTRLNVKDLQGTIVAAADTVELHQLSGALGAMHFEADGEVNATQARNLDVRATDISLDDLKQLAVSLKLPSSAELSKQPVSGTVKKASLTVSGDLRQPKITLDATPQSISFMPSRVKRLLILNGGRILFDGKLASFANLSGSLGKDGTFVLNGSLDPVANGHMDLRFKSGDLDIDDVKSLLQDLKISSPLLKEKQLYGKIATAVGEIKGSAKNPSVALKVVPTNLYYQPLGKDRTFELKGGVIGVKDGNLQFENANGRLGAGKFWLNGEVSPNVNEPVSLEIKAENIDLSNVKMSFAALNVQTPLMAEELLYGTVNSVNLKMKGTAKTPIIDMVALPNDLLYEPLGSSRVVHLTGGKITFSNDVLTLTNVAVTSPRSKMKVNLKFGNLSKDATVLDATIDSTGMDLGDLHSYLAADKTPRLVRDRYLSELHDNALTAPSGKAKGHFELHLVNGQYEAHGTIFFKDVASKLEGYPAHDIRGKIVAEKDLLRLEDVTGMIGKSPFQASGVVNQFVTSNKRNFDFSSTLTLDLNDFLAQIGSAQAKNVTASKPLNLKADVTGTAEKLIIKFSGNIDGDADLSFMSPLGLIKKRPGQQFTTNGTIEIGKSDATLHDVLVAFGSSQVRLNGKLMSAAQEGAEPTLDVTMDIPNPIPAEHLIGFLPKEHMTEALKTVSGDIRGQLDLKGAINNPAVRGTISFNNLGIPEYQFSRMSGSIVAPSWITAKANDKNSRQSEPFQLKIKTLYLKKLPVTNIQGNLFAGYYQDRRVIRLTDVTADIARGKLKLRMGVDQSKPEFGGSAQLTGVDINQLFTELLDAPNEITGTLDATVQHFSAAQDSGSNFYNTLQVKNGTYQVVRGRVARFSLLQRRITQANLIKGGLLGFNLNNLLMSVAPVRNGDFKIINGTFVLHPNLYVTFNDARFDGDELRLRAGGYLDFMKKQMHVDVAGDTARTSKRGPLGPVARFFSIRGLATQVTDDLPGVPKGFADNDNKPRTFQFAINAPTDNASKVTSSIMKSFHWLAPKPNATAHPLVAQTNASAPVAAAVH